MLSIMAEKSVAGAVADIGAAAVPTLAVENDYRTGRCGGLSFMFDFEPFWRGTQTAFMRAGHDACAADFGAEVVEHPDGVHHHWGVHIEHIDRDVAVQALVAVAGADDTRVEAAEN